jgi:phage shock protein E
LSHAPFAVSIICFTLEWRHVRSILEDMNLTIAFILLIVLTAFILLKRAGQISTKKALAHLKNGALVIDVRTPSEFSSGHLPSAINLPLDQIETALPRRVKDKSQVILLHCQSGMRSGVAKKKLNALGYSNAFNLGSYGRAAEIAGKR